LILVYAIFRVRIDTEHRRKKMTNYLINATNAFIN
jgi:hypothetical protein